MPAVMEAIDRMSTAEKVDVMNYLWAALSKSGEKFVPVWHVVNPQEEREPVRKTVSERKKPCISDFIGYGAKFHKLRSTEEWMKELREGEEE